LAGNPCLHTTLHSFVAVSEEIGTSLAVTRALGTLLIKYRKYKIPILKFEKESKITTQLLTKRTSP